MHLTTIRVSNFEVILNFCRIFSCVSLPCSILSKYRIGCDAKLAAAKPETKPQFIHTTEESTVHTITTKLLITLISQIRKSVISTTSHGHRASTDLEFVWLFTAV